MPSWRAAGPSAPRAGDASDRRREGQGRARDLAHQGDERPEIVRGAVSGNTWGTWISVLKAAFAEPMTEAEIALFRTVAERDPPKKRVKQLWVVAGRRAGKNSIAGSIAAYAAAFQSYDMLRPGERAHVMCLASDKDQARIVLNYIRSYFNDIAMLKPLVSKETALNGLILNNGVEISVVTNSFRAVRGRSIALAVLDEVAYWRDETSASPDVETFAALRPGMMTIPNAMMVGISSPYKRAGLLYDRWRAAFGKNDDNVLVVRGPSTVFNPTLDPAEIEAAMAEDPARARAEYFAEWRDDIASYLPRELVEAAVDTGVIVRPPIPGLVYVAGADPSGGVSNSYCCAISHAEGVNGEVAILDNLIEIKPPFSPAAATAQIAATLKSYGVSTVVGDRYAQSWVIEAFHVNGIRYKHSERDRSAIYADCLPLFTSGRVRLLDSTRLVSQFSQLERKTTPGGRDFISHPERTGHHDDAANACALALINAAGAQRPRATAHFGGVATRSYGSGQMNPQRNFY